MNPTETKMRPILFSTEMVRAILAGRKTQTRRMVKRDLANHYFQSLVHHTTGKFTFVENGNYNPKEYDVVEIKCPYGAVGDVLWVREKFRYSDDLDEPYDYYEDFIDKYIPEEVERSKGTWKPSIHMPREAARLFLKITDIRVERLQDISEADAVAEGIENFMDKDDKLPIYRNYLATRKDLEIDAYSHCANGPEDSFRSLWQKINGPDSWEANPWVWVVQFERIDKPAM